MNSQQFFGDKIQLNILSIVNSGLSKMFSILFLTLLFTFVMSRLNWGNEKLHIRMLTSRLVGVEVRTYTNSYWEVLYENRYFTNSYSIIKILCIYCSVVKIFEKHLVAWTLLKCAYFFFKYFNRGCRTAISIFFSNCTFYYTVNFCGDMSKNIITQLFLFNA